MSTLSPFADGVWLDTSRSADEERVAPIRWGVSSELDDARHRVGSIVVLPWAVVDAVASRGPSPALKPAKLAAEAPGREGVPP